MPNRREVLACAVGSVLASTMHTAAADPRGRTALGVVIHSYPLRSRLDREVGFSDPERFLDFCADRGAAGIQLPLGVRDAAYASRLRSTAEAKAMYVEGSSRTPKDRADLDRFEAEVKTAKACGGSVIRTVMLGGRRYEVFRSADDYRTFEKAAVRSLELAAPVAEKHGVRLAVENHKDFRSGEMADLFKRLSSEWIGICLDTGNNIALLEDPLDTARLLAPWAIACHLKDMGLEEAPEGFLLSEVPLGAGYLDLKGIIGTLKKANPRLRFSLEMITRDPLRIPCLEPRYWATLESIPAPELARTLATVRRNAGKNPLPRVSRLPVDEQRKLEDNNVRQSLAYARTNLGL